MNRSTPVTSYVQMTLPMDLTIRAEARDFDIALAYLEMHSITEVSRQLQVSRKTVRMATRRFCGILKRARQKQYVPTGFPDAQKPAITTNTNGSNTV